MKPRSIIMAIVITAISLGCTEELQEPNQTFYKVFGKELQSFGVNVKILSNGNFCILGTTETFGINENLGQKTNSTEAIKESSASLTIADPAGNFIRRELFPLEVIYTQIAIGNIPADGDRGFLNDIIEVSGGYLVTGEFPFLEVTVPGLYNDRLPNIPFMLRLDENFGLEEVISMNAETPAWDLVGRSRPNLFQSNNGSINILYEGSDSLISTGRQWFSIDQRDELGEKIIRKSYTNTETTEFWGVKGVALDGAKNLVAFINHNYSGVSVAKVNSETLELELENDLVDPKPGKNINGSAILYDPEADEYVLLYHALGLGMQFIKLNNQLEMLSEDPKLVTDARGNGIRGGRTLHALIDDEFIFMVYGLDDTAAVFKLDKEGNIIWRHDLEGASRGIVDTGDGIVVLVNPKFNGPYEKATLVKMTKDGRL